MSQLHDPSGHTGYPRETLAEPAQATMNSDLVDESTTVAEAMTVCARTCSPMSTVLEAVMVFRDAECGAIPITDTGRPVGVLTDRDVALAISTHPNDLGRTPVGDLMNKDVVTIDLDETLDAAMDKLGDHGVRRLMIVDSNGLLQGVLSWTDLIPHLSPAGRTRSLEDRREPIAVRFLLDSQICLAPRQATCYFPQGVHSLAFRSRT